VQVGVPLGVTHQGTVKITIDTTHNNTVVGPKIAPNAYMNVFASLALDSLTGDTCFLNGTGGCADDESSAIDCSVMGNIINWLLKYQEEDAYTFTIYLGQYQNCSQLNPPKWCDWLVNNWCSFDTTPPDSTYNGEYILDQYVHQFWGTVSACYRDISTNPKGPWICFHGAAQGLDGNYGLQRCTSNPY